MLIVGHTALAYLVTRPLLGLDKSILKPVNILLIFIFANLIDVINFSIFRYFAHTLIGIYLFSIIWLLIFYKLKIIEKGIVPLLLIAISLQPLADYIFGEVYFFAPFIDTSCSVFNHTCEIIHFADSIAFLMFLLVFILTGDLQNMKVFILREKNKLLRNIKIKNIFKSKHLALYLFIAFYLFAIAQFIFFILTHLDMLMDIIFVTWIFLFLFIIFLAILTFIGFGKMPTSNQQIYSYNR